MRIVSALLVSRVVPGWPDQVIPDSIPLGREYRVDLDSVRVGTLRQREHPEWSPITLSTIALADNPDNWFRLPLCCLRIEPDV